MATNPTSLSRAFKHAFGISIAEHLRRPRRQDVLAAVAAAKQLKQAASEIGCSEATFRRDL